MYIAIVKTKLLGKGFGQLLIM